MAAQYVSTRDNDDMLQTLLVASKQPQLMLISAIILHTAAKLIPFHLFHLNFYFVKNYTIIL